MSFSKGRCVFFSLFLNKEKKIVRSYLFVFTFLLLLFFLINFDMGELNGVTVFQSGGLVMPFNQPSAGSTDQGKDKRMGSKRDIQ